MGRFTSFVMFAEMRTGSNFLEANLNAIPGLVCHGELFNPVFIGQHNRFDLWDIDIPARNADPLQLLQAMRAQTAGLGGFRLFHDHDPRVTAAVLADPACAKIILTRNPLDSYVSLLIARETGQWRLMHGRARKEAKVTFDAAGFAAHVADLQAFQIHLMRSLQTSGQTAFWIDYDDIGELSVLNGLAAWLGVPGRIEALDGRLKVQNPEPVTEKVTNPDQMAAALAALDRFNLARTPNFEPRRPPAIPAWVAGGRLLYMPVQGGPVDAVTGWLAGLGPLQRDFTQKSLRQWKRDAGAHRAFTVLRHPVARARAAFEGRLLSGQRQDVWQALVRDLKVDLPPPGTPLDAGQDEAAFLGFLRYVRLSLAGQMPQRVDAAWATQVAVLQGFSSAQIPDAVLREDRMATGLAGLCADLGLPCPPVPQPAAPPKVSPEAEALIRDVYARDFAAFGFA